MPTEDMPNTNQGSGYRTLGDKIPENAGDVDDAFASKSRQIKGEIKGDIKGDIKGEIKSSLNQGMNA